MVISSVNMSTIAEITQLVSAGSMTAEEAARKITALSNNNKTQIYYKVSPKGAVSFYGLRRMPITMYIEELEKIVGQVMADPNWSTSFQEFVNQAGDSLKRKG